MKSVFSPESSFPPSSHPGNHHVVALAGGVSGTGGALLSQAAPELWKKLRNRLTEGFLPGPNENERSSEAGKRGDQVRPACRNDNTRPAGMDGDYAG